MRNPEHSMRALGDAIDHDIADTVQHHFGTPRRQASDALALVVLALFIGTSAILLRLVMD